MQQRKRPGRPKPHWPKSDSALSLFDELFPEEMLAKSSEQTLAEQRLDKLPAFNWTPDINVGDYPEEKIDTYNQIPQPDPLNPATLPTEYTPVTNISQLREGMRQTMLEDEQSPKGPSVLVLNACSKNLEESDFFRISPKGEHIEGWKSGLLKVIPSRDNKSFEPLGSYFLLFSSDAAARAYLDQTMRLHTLTRLEQTQKQARFPLPPGYLKEEENVQSLLKSFSLVPGFVKLSMRMLSRPYSTRVQTLINEGGPVAVASKEAKAQHMVLFTTDRSHITHGDVADALRQDGKRRNMHWNLAGDRRTSIIRIQNKAREEGDNSVTQKRGKLGGRRTYDGPGRFIITFKDSHEARRFVREWHCRPLHIQQDIRAEDEPPPIVNAEILW
ncbi:uncharacterized protein LY89DRAFT_671753 [Mollisia scopiformis]|uniref:Uncharacterized protein n=1 Tax=Mollisia scopiformis TaxID=149040 RepID=A0A194X3J9_MOLSC|nr:uncharacterized protein LY89DRAFT_671753 [Mollisia scopiformis]KUJ14402.1 hypothetical protein LY89DRAFT_671753 [Mollisia scopiformis]